jgi:cell division protein FtsA
VGSGAVLALDIGSAKISALLARAAENRLDILGLGRSLSRGVRRGSIVDLDEAADAIREAVDNAGRRARLAPAWVAVSGPHFAGLTNSAAISITRPSREILSSDLDQAVRAAGEISLPEGREIVHIVPSHFVVDGLAGVKRPAGLSASALQAKVHIITASSAALDNAEKCLKRAEIALEDFIFSPLACAEAAFGAAPPQGPHLLIDIGAGTTDYVLFSDGGPVLSGSLPLGGAQIAQDLCIGLRLPLDQSEQLLQGAAVGMAALARGQPPVVLRASDGGQRRVTPLAAAEIIEARLQEILAEVRAQLIRGGAAAVLSGGAVLTGGVSRIAGAVALAEQVLSCPVRAYGAPLAGLLPDVVQPDLAAVTGAALIGLRHSARSLPPARGGWLRSLAARAEAIKRAILGS